METCVWRTLLFAFVVTGVACLPRRQLNLDCQNFLCTTEPDPVCGTDGNTYASMCEMQMENKKRMCWIGHYNMVTKLYDGPCSVSTPAAVIG